jgi:phosphoribosylanthranilate isomerase
MISAKFGAGALGFNFYRKSPRYIAPEKAREIIDQLPRRVMKVGVFVNEAIESVSNICKIAGLDVIQLHGDETPDYAERLIISTGLKAIKAFRVSKAFEPQEVVKFQVDAILLDAYSPKEYGGSGLMFDWDILQQVRSYFGKIYLAGGLTPDNVAEAIKRVKPYAVDVCGGLESSKGIKDAVKVERFMAEARRFYE